jgi:hypothetical protein
MVPTVVGKGMVYTPNSCTTGSVGKGRNTGGTHRALVPGLKTRLLQNSTRTSKVQSDSSSRISTSLTSASTNFVLSFTNCEAEACLSEQMSAGSLTNIRTSKRVCALRHKVGPPEDETTPRTCTSQPPARICSRTSPRSPAPMYHSHCRCQQTHTADLAGKT